MGTEKVITMTERELKKIIESTVNATLLQLGIEHDDPLEMQKDFQHLRNWRESTDRLKTKTLGAAIVFLVLGGIGAMWLGMKEAIRQFITGGP